MRKDLDKYFYCTGCIWDTTCDNSTITINGSIYHIAPGGECDDYSPADGSDAVDFYRRDLAERAGIYNSLVEEYQ